ncbi:UNVERIFIED_CONTAM: hypothetical protein GTU68_060210 [Idotea baltica]|nr:hypothetical protein [Idotea baltica]
MNDNKDKWILAFTGASGIIYGLRVLDELEKKGLEVHVVFSDAALRVLNDEEDVAVSQRESSNITFYSPKDIGAKLASGSVLFKGMLIVPCSMGTLGAIANGLSQNLIQRAADVTIKEGRQLVIVPRETPLSAIHLENMLKLSRIGVSIVPAMPGFYLKPKNISELVDHQVLKILDIIKIPKENAKRWG